MVQITNGMSGSSQPSSHRLAVLAGGSDGAAGDLTRRATAAAEQLAAVEAVLVDVHRESPRDVLRNPAGLNDALVNLISTVSLSDTAPTTQAVAVAQEVMARVGAEIGKVERLVTTEIAAVNRLALEQEVAADSRGFGDNAVSTQSVTGAAALRILSAFAR